MKYLNENGTQRIINELNTSSAQSSWVVDYQEYNETLSGFNTYVYQYANNTFKVLTVMMSNATIDANFVRLSSSTSSGLSALTYYLFTVPTSWYSHVSSSWTPVKATLNIIQTSNWCWAVPMAGGVYHNWRLLNFGKANFTASVQFSYEVIGTI